MRKRIDVRISEELDLLLRNFEVEDGIPRHDVLRRGLAVMKAYRDQRKRGKSHLGFVGDPSRLDVEILNVL